MDATRNRVTTVLGAIQFIFAVKGLSGDASDFRVAGFPTGANVPVIAIAVAGNMVAALHGDALIHCAIDGIIAIWGHTWDTSYTLGTVFYSSTGVKVIA